MENKDYIDAEALPAESQALQAVNTPVALQQIQQDLSPADLRQEIARQKEMRQILVDYVRSELVEGHHFYSFNKLGNPNSPVADKPALSQDGANLINGLFKAIPGPVKTRIERGDDGHFTVYAEASLMNQNGFQIATGDGMCSTRESKYAYRKGERACPTCGANAIIKGKAEYGGGWVCFAKKGGCGAKFDEHDESITSQMVGRIENPDLADIENTVLKMACKRAAVAATRKLPLVSELFTQDRGEPANEQMSAQPARGAGRKPAASSNRASAPVQNISMIDSAVSLSKKLIEYGLEFEDIAVQFLPEGVARFEDLSEDAARETIPAMSELLNSRIAATRKAA